MNSPVIKPTVGRRVWFRPSAAFLERNPTVTQLGQTQPMDAGIVYVHHDHMVNLAVCDHVGRTHMVPSVPLLVGQWDPSDDDYFVCEWMPYQKGQAAKVEAKEAAAVLNNPHTGTPRDPRDPRDVASDPQAILCVKPGEPLKAATVTLPVVDPGPDSLEREIQAKANRAPRVTPADIEAEIASEHFFTAEDGVGRASKGQTSNGGKNPPALSLLTFCVLVLRNGFTVTGESACASPENFNAEIGRRIARENAVNKVWPLLGFRLRDELARPVLTEADAAADLAGTPRPDNPSR